MTFLPTDMRTDSGLRVPIGEPRPWHVSASDIIAAMQRICRFNGHRDIRLLEHSMNVASRVGRNYKQAAFLHDAHEIYTGDFIRPLLRLLPEVREQIQTLQAKWDAAIAARFGLRPDMLSADVVREADEDQLDNEIHRASRNPPSSEDPWEYLGGRGRELVRICDFTSQETLNSAHRLDLPFETEEGNYLATDGQIAVCVQRRFANWEGNERRFATKHSWPRGPLNLFPLGRQKDDQDWKPFSARDRLVQLSDRHIEILRGLTAIHVLEMPGEDVMAFRAVGVEGLVTSSPDENEEE